MTIDTRAWHVPGIEQWPQRGGVACLDFANTVAFRPRSQPVDGLRDYDDLLTWSQMAGLLSRDDIGRLNQAGRHDDAARGDAMVTAQILREAIHAIFSALAAGNPASASHLSTVNSYLVAGMSHSQLVAGPDGFTFSVPPAHGDLERPLWLIAESAARLLLSGNWRRVHVCPGDDCGWLFLDQTKNGNRRWCDSADCGNRARGRAHTQRQRQRQLTDPL